MFNFTLYSLITLFIVVCFLLIMLILIQKGRGGGLAGAFGGGGGGNTAFGSKTGDVLTWATSIVFGVFILLGVVLNLIANYQQARITGPVATQTVPAGPVTPAPEPSPVPGQ